MELAVFNKNGQKTDKKVKLNDEIFAVEPNDHAIYLDVKQHMANRRQGTHKTKERGEIKGSTRKIKRQKGTGTARAGSIKNPLFRGGGRIFGPEPRDYGFKLNKKLKRLARISALTYKAKDNDIFIVEDFKFEDHKTRNFVQLLQNLEVPGNKTLLVTTQRDSNLVLSSRNLKNIRVVNAGSINTYDILNANNLLLCESSIEEIEKNHLSN